MFHALLLKAVCSAVGPNTVQSEWEGAMTLLNINFYIVHPHKYLGNSGLHIIILLF